MWRVLFLSLIAIFIQNSLGFPKETSSLVKNGYFKDGTYILLESPETIDAVKGPKRCTLDYDDRKFGGRWNKTKISYGITKMTKKLTESDVLIIIEKALKEWGKHSGHTFKQTYGKKPDISIGFYKGDHNDSKPFTGKDTHVAHAFFPPEAAAHLNDYETYSILTSSNETVVELHSLMLHLTGHAMGLKHSSDKGSIMYPMIRTKGNLNSDDIAKIRELYSQKGKPDGSTSTTNFPKISTSTTHSPKTSTSKKGSRTTPSSTTHSPETSTSKKGSRTSPSSTTHSPRTSTSIKGARTSPTSTED